MVDLIDIGEFGPDPKEAEHEKPAPRQGLWNELQEARKKATGRLIDTEFLDDSAAGFIGALDDRKQQMLELEEEEEAMIKEQVDVLDSALATEEPN